MSTGRPDIFDVDLVVYISLLSMSLMALFARWEMMISFGPLLLTWAFAAVVVRWLHVPREKPLTAAVPSLIPDVPDDGG
jgi:hypothetical protein